MKSQHTEQDKTESDIRFEKRIAAIEALRNLDLNISSIDKKTAQVVIAALKYIQEILCE